MKWETNSLLLLRLRDPGEQTVWMGFSAAYRSRITRFAEAGGLTADEAEDVAQETLLQCAQGMARGQFDRRRGRIGPWLLGIARNQLLHCYRRRQVLSRSELVGALGVEDVDDGLAGCVSSELERWWEREWTQALIGRALRQLRHDVSTLSFSIYVRSVLEGHSADRIAEELGVLRSRVYNVRSRLNRRMRELIVAQLDD